MSAEREFWLAIDCDLERGRILHQRSEEGKLSMGGDYRLADGIDLHAYRRCLEHETREEQVVRLLNKVNRWLNF